MDPKQSSTNDSSQLNRDSLITPMGANPAQPQIDNGDPLSTPFASNVSPASDNVPAWPQSQFTAVNQPVSAFSAPPGGSATIAPQTYSPNPSANIFNPNHNTPTEPQPINLPQASQPVQPIPIDLSTPSPQMNQQTSPIDPPPAPVTPNQIVPDAAGLTTAVVSDKPKRGKAPVFLIILLLLVVAVLSVVGYLAYQNYNLSKAVQPTANEPITIPTTTDPYSDYTTHKSTLLPVEFMVPGNWIIDESEDPEIANQKMIKANSTDFAYQGSEIASGFEFRVGPVNDLTKKYDTFEAFSAEENTNSLYTTKIINQTSWLVKDSEAKTLLGKSPLTISLYTSPSLAANGLEIFNRILNSFKIVSTSSALPISPTSIPATPSASPLE